jgi:ubiquinone/menaquinone biosynthesis C-methylase UbiE
MSKDYFSGDSKAYAAFRPTYPDELYRFIFDQLKERSVAWDCATGNGQVAQYLSNHFNEVYATDISQQQLDHAYRAENIFYLVSKAERCPFEADTFDLITVAQALHWIDTTEFYKEVNRTAKADAIIAVWGYNLLQIDPALDALILDFYRNKVGKYWDSARKLVDEEYRSVPFPFEAIETPRFQLCVNWNADQLQGYLTTWSATQKYYKVTGQNPVPDLMRTLQLYWKKEEIKPVTFPIFMKLGRIIK